MKKKRLIPLFVLSTLLLAGCAGNPGASSESGSSEGSESSSSSAPANSETTSSAGTPDVSSSEGFSDPSSDASVPTSIESSTPSSQEEEAKTIVLSRNNGGILGKSYSGQEITNSEAKAPDGTSFPITYVNGIKPNGDYASFYGQFKRTEGVLHNTNSLSKLTSIKVTYTSKSKAQFCFSSTENPGSYKTLESGVAYPAHGETHFFVKAGGSVLYIETIEITYGGEALPDSEGSGSEEGKTWDTDYSASNATKVDEVNKNLSLYDLQYNTPTEGTQSVLVLPIEFTDKKFSKQDLEDIRTLTGGTAEDTKYWESLKTYYAKSSYGKLNLTFEYADPINLGQTAKSLYQEGTSNEDYARYAYGSAKALKKGVETYKTIHGSDSTKKFDADGDGLIDSVIMIYAEDYTPSYDENGDLYWAYRFWDYWDDDLKGMDVGVTESKESPNAFSYFWASLSFFYDGVGGTQGNGVDSHTLIHEFGHMLGADDYYNTDDSASEPTGGLTMMAYNVLDHDSFNKLQYGWVNPYYVTGSTEITINSFTETGDCILLADEGGWNGTAFDEYVLIEYYTPTGLNALDGNTAYDGRGTLNQSGVRIWHVDNRLYLYDPSTNREKGWASDSQIASGDFGNYGVDFAINNSDANYYSAASNSFNALSLISSKGTRFTKDRSAQNKDLFQAGDEFSLVDSSVSSKYASYFAGKTRLDNGNELPYKVEITSTNSSSASIRITKKA